MMSIGVNGLKGGRASAEHDVREEKWHEANRKPFEGASDWRRLAAFHPLCRMRSDIYLPLDGFTTRRIHDVLVVAH